MRGETRRKARSRYPGDEALRRVSPRRRRERRRRERERGRDPEHRAELPRVPCAVTVGANAERTEAGGGELCRTRPRRRICIRRAGRRTHKSAALHSIPRRPKGGVREADALAGVSTVALTVTAHWKAAHTSTEHQQECEASRTLEGKPPHTTHASCAACCDYAIISFIRREAGKSCGIQALSRSRQSRNAAPAHNLKYPRKRGKEER